MKYEKEIASRINPSEFGLIAFPIGSASFRIKSYQLRLITSSPADMARIVSGCWVRARQRFAHRVVEARDGGEATFGERLVDERSKMFGGP